MFYNDIWLERNLITPLKEVKLLKLKKQQTVDAIMRQAMDEYINERKAELYQL